MIAVFTHMLRVRIILLPALLTEGVYRIPGNTAKVELLKEMFDHNKEDLDINSIDVGVNAVATALKGFFSDLSEPLIPSHLNDGLVVADSKSTCDKPAIQLAPIISLGRLLYIISCNNDSRVYIP